MTFKKDVLPPANKKCHNCFIERNFKELNHLYISEFKKNFKLDNRICISNFLCQQQRIRTCYYVLEPVLLIFLCT